MSRPLGFCFVEVAVDDQGSRRVNAKATLTRGDADVPPQWQTVVDDGVASVEAGYDKPVNRDNLVIAMMLMDALAAVTSESGVSLHDFIAAYYGSTDAVVPCPNVTPRLMEALQTRMDRQKAARRKPVLSLVPTRNPSD